MMGQNVASTGRPFDAAPFGAFYRERGIYSALPCCQEVTRASVEVFIRAATMHNS